MSEQKILKVTKTITINPDIYARMKTTAGEDRRTVSGMIEFALEEWLKIRDGSVSPRVIPHSTKLNFR